MIKVDELRNQFSCLNNAHPYEPIFVLRANDPLFAATLHLWAAMAVDIHEPEKVLEARALAEQGEKWRGERQPKAMPGVAIDSDHSSGLNAQQRSYSQIRGHLLPSDD